MELHHLTLRAIGPYAGEYSIDFAELGASGVFLLEGPTGSGKSTIIDAVVFGLYGVPAGSSTTPERLHSHHAAPDVEPFVELVFSTGSGIYRIRRSPQWFRPKSRGTGTTKANASATLVRLTSPDAASGEPVSSSTQEIGSEIPAIVGLTREQFEQTVVLPQGEFARFLGASGEERRLVLQSLFGTRIYDDTTEVLAELRRAAHGEVMAAQKAIDEALAGLRVAADDATLEAGGADEAVSGAAAVSAEAVRLRDEARVARDAAEQARAAQMALADGLARRAGLLARREALVEEAPAVEADRTRADLGRRAQAVAPARAARRSAGEALERAATVVSEAEASDPAVSALDLDELVARRDALLGEIAALAALVDLERGFDGRDVVVVRLEADVESGAAQLAADRSALEARAAARLELVVARDDLAGAASGLDAAVRRVADLGGTVEAVRERDELQAAVSAAGAQVAVSAAAAREAIDTEAAMRRRRIEGMAGELATQLVAGEPCAVCGSLTHPSPAVLTDEHPSDDAIELAAAARETAEQLNRQHSEASATLAARLGVAARQIGAVDVEHLDEQLAAARTAVAAAEQARADGEAARKALDGFDQQTAALTTAVQTVAERQAASTERVEGERRALADDRARVARVLDGRASSCRDLAARLEAEQTAVSRLLAARRAREQALVDDRARDAELREALAGAGFEALSALDTAAVPRAALEELTQRVSRHDRDRAVVDEQLASAELAVLTGDETVDVPAAVAVAEAADERLRGVASSASIALDRAERISRSAVVLRAAERAASAVSSRSRAVVRMADVTGANGPENLRGVTLGTYVLLRRFDDVLAAANSRLAVMSSGRYLLESSDTRESGSRSRKTGLALVIRDNTTDTTRDPKSFSGGETFYASLSLALGLADVVQAEAGGIGLGTLFVDEGFGTLDPETLDSVMSELGRLSAGGRVVGIVSHVEDLKQRIADRIEVRRLPDGSSTLSTSAGR
ncbi:hypothetical protein AX769_01800 [Frondihabitans sp. PAMC 28766]|uniref:AAA family ATPase n=1 Tax=Frondihabitans sp. PAMC 28766 TaxID=1795630 RepID=UPI00078DF518|nr:SMC family ATPase [Frondihabitans sp. PAMC 28766]AMM19098.1 hypothetical protein AX769_01800 [Frondihabitans sp. PAMC 28766]